MRNKLFGEALTEGIRSVAAHQRRKVSNAEQEIAEKLGYTRYTVQRWRKGHVPREEGQIEFLAEYVIRNSNLGREWLDRLLLHARYFDRNRLLDELCPLRPIRVYHNLPRRPMEFIGRQQEVELALQAIRSRHPLVSIEGMGGMGKTSLAVEVAHVCLPDGEAGLEEPFEAAVFISAKDRDLKLNDLFDTISYTLDLPYIAQLSPERKLQEVGRALREHKVLIIADNFETVTDESLLIFLQREIPEPSKAIITTRQEQLRMVWPIPLRGLADADAIELIRRQARTLQLVEITRAEDGELRPLVEVAGGNPYVIVTSLGYLKRGALTLRELVNALYQAGESVDEIFQYIFARAWEVMGEEAQSILMVMPFFVGEVSREAIGVASALEGYYLRRGIETLMEMSLLQKVESEREPRYTVHPLTRSFAIARLREQPGFEEQARVRWCDYFLQLATSLIVRDMPKERYWNSLMSTRDLARVDPEWPNLLNVLAWADQKEQDRALIELMMLLVHYMDRRGLFSTRLYYAEKAAEAAGRMEQGADEGRFRIDALGWTLMEEGRFTDAEEEIRKGLSIAQDLGAEAIDDTNDLIALAHTRLARVYLEQGKLEEASAEMVEAVSVPRRSVVQSHVSMTAGDLAHRNGDHEEAIKLYSDALQVGQQYGGPTAGFELHYRLGFAYLSAGDAAQAEIKFNQALDDERLGFTVEGLRAKYGLACVAQAKGDEDKARQLAQETMMMIPRLDIGHSWQSKIEELLNSLGIG